MPSRRNLLLILAAVALAAWLYHQFRHSPEWRQFSWHTVWAATRGARASWLIAALMLSLSTYVWRTLRWLTLMPPGGRFQPVLRGTAIGFTGIALMGRPGEVIRPYYIARKHRAPALPQFAVLVLERAFDMGTIVLLVGLALALSPQMKALTEGTPYEGAFRKAGLVLTAFVLGVFLLLVWFRHRAPKILARLQRPGAGGGRRRLAHFVETLAHGIGSLSHPGRLFGAIAFSLINWFAATAALWFVVRAYSGMLPGFSLAGALLLLAFTVVGAVIQLPAVGGGMQVLTLFALTNVFGAAAAPAASAALIVWLLSFYAVAPFGVWFAARDGISWRRFEQEAMAAEVGEASA